MSDSSAPAARLLLAASITRYLGQVVVLATVGRLGGPVDLGEFTLSLALLNPLYIITSFGLRNVILTFRTPLTLPALERFRLSTLAWVVGFSALVTALIVPPIWNVLLVVAAFKTLESVLEVYQGFLQRADKEAEILKGTLLLTAAQLASFAALLSIQLPVLDALLFSYLVYGALLFTLIRQRAFSLVRASSVAQSDNAIPVSNAAILRAGTPIGISLFLLSLLSAFPQYFLGYFGDVVDAGRFAILSYVLVSVEMLLNALSQAWIRMARQLDFDGTLSYRAVYREAYRWQLTVVPVTLIGITAVGLGAPLIFGPSHQTSAPELITLAMGAAILPFVFAGATAINVKNRYVVGLTTSATAVVVSVIAALVMVQVDGDFSLLDALVTFFLGLALRAAMSLSFVRRLTVEPSLFKDVRP